MFDQIIVYCLIRHCNTILTFYAVKNDGQGQQCTPAKNRPKVVDVTCSCASLAQTVAHLIHCARIYHALILHPLSLHILQLLAKLVSEP